MSVTSRMFSFRSNSMSVEGPPSIPSNTNSVNDDTQSVASESSFSTEMSWITSEKNIFLSGIRSFGTSTDSAEVDESMKNLYLDTIVLEEKCKQSSGPESSRRSRNLTTSSLRKHQAEEDARGSVLKTHKKPQEVIDSLPECFFTKEYDPVEKQLLEVSSWRDLDLTEKFMILIEEADIDKDMVLSKLATMIEASHDDLMTCMRDVHAIDVDLARTAVQVVNSRRKLQSAEELLVKGSTKITQMYEFRERLDSVKALLESLKRVRDLFESIETHVDAGDTFRAAEAALTLFDLLQSETVEHLNGAQSYGGGVQEYAPIIRYVADCRLLGLCVVCGGAPDAPFSVELYESVLRSYLLLDYMREVMGVQNVYTPSSNPTPIVERSHSYRSGGSPKAVGSPADTLDEGDDEDEEDDEENIEAYSFSRFGPGGGHLAQHHQKLLQRTLHDSYGCIEGICPRVLRYTTTGVENAIRTALIEAITSTSLHANTNNSSQSDASRPHSLSLSAHEQDSLHQIPGVSRQPSFQNHGPARIVVGLGLGLELKELYDRLTGDMIVPCIVRSCQLIIDTVHTYFLIVQWHRFPFDERNMDPAFLHSISLADTDRLTKDADQLWVTQNQLSPSGGGGDASINGHGTFGATNNLSKLGENTLWGSKEFISVSRNAFAMGSSHSSDTEEIKSLVGSSRALLIGQSEQQFQSVYLELVDSRRLLWESVEKHLEDLLDASSPSSSIPVESFLVMVWGLEKIVALGKEFCGATSESLQARIKSKSAEYVVELHKEYFQRLRQMVEAETWKSVPIKLADMGGILGLIRSNLRREARAHGKGYLRVRGMVAEIASLERKQSDFRQGKHPRNVGIPKTRSSGGFSGPDAKPQQGGDLENVVTGGGSSFTANKSIIRDSQTLCSYFVSGNPLEPLPPTDSSVNPSNSNNNNNNNNNNGSNNSDEDFTSTTDLLSFLFEDDLPSVTLSAGRRTSAMIVTQSALNGLARYVAKYLQLMYVMRSVSLDVLQGLCQLFDFYLCSVFNCFVPQEERQRCLSKSLPKMSATAPCLSKDFEALQQFMQRVLAGIPAGSLASYGTTLSLGARESEHDVQQSEYTSSAINSLSAQLQQTSMLFAKLLPRTPANVETPAEESLFALNEHIVAAESCWFVSKLLDDLKPKLQRLLTSESDVAWCDTYVSDFSLVAGQLRALVYKCMCPRIIGQNWSTVIADTSGWDVKKMREDPHDWVEGILSKCRDVWSYLSRGEEFAEASSLVREQVWLELCQTAFDILLEGFSRVRKISTEGRACMAMDISALHSGLDAIHQCRPPRGKLHVDNYVRACYLSEDEVIEWVRNNWHSYAYRHLHGLLTQVLGTSNSNMNVNIMKKKRLTTALAVLDGLHDEVTGEDASTVKESNTDLSSKIFGKRFG